MKNKENYNWWTDPKNAEEVKRVSWWDHPENQTTIELSVAIIEGEKYFVVSPSKETDKLIGEHTAQVAQGETKEEAIRNFFSMIRFKHEYETECRLNYQRWVPFRKGPWGKTGGNWFAIFGIHIYFRYEKRVKMKGGWYIPFTKLNISMSNDWIVYKRYKNESRRNKKTT